jgi:hypothetical protein
MQAVLLRANQAFSHVKKFRGRRRTDAAGEIVKGGAMPPPPLGVLRLTATAGANDQIVRAPFCMARTTA